MNRTPIIWIRCYGSPLVDSESTGDLYIKLHWKAQLSIHHHFKSPAFCHTQTAGASAGRIWLWIITKTKRLSSDCGLSSPEWAFVSTALLTQPDSRECLWSPFLGLQEIATKKWNQFWHNAAPAILRSIVTYVPTYATPLRWVDRGTLPSMHGSSSISDELGTRRILVKMRWAKSALLAMDGTRCRCLHWM